MPGTYDCAIEARSRIGPVGGDGAEEIDVAALLVDLRLDATEVSGLHAVRQAAPVGRGATEDAGALAEGEDLHVARGGQHRVLAALPAESLLPGHARAVGGRVGRDRGEAAKIPALAGGIVLALLADDEDRIAGLEARGHTFEPQLGEPRGERLRLREDGAERVEIGARDDVLDRLVGLRLLVGPGDALDAGALGDGHRRGRALRCFEREDEVDAGRYPGTQRVTDEARQLDDADALGRGAQVGLVGDALLVEGEHVGDDGEGVEQGNGEVIGLAGAQVAERRTARVREAGEHALEEIGVDPDAVRDRR
ncbi:MAG: hypothetical protein QM820_29125 [Minicystis sp.]